MKVLDLQCQYAHSFEGWFGSEDDFQSQLARGLVECPMCGDSTITKKLSAPRLNLLASRAVGQSAREPGAQRQADADESGANPTTPATGSVGTLARVSASSAALISANQSPTTKPLPAAMHAMLQDPQFQAAYLQMARSIMAQTEDVGNQFAEEARKIHYGEADKRAIRGEATQDEALELLDEGIDVLRLPLPKALKASLQ